MPTHPNADFFCSLLLTLIRTRQLLNHTGEVLNMPQISSTRLAVGRLWLIYANGQGSKICKLADWLRQRSYHRWVSIQHMDRHLYRTLLWCIQIISSSRRSDNRLGGQLLSRMYILPCSDKTAFSLTTSKTLSEATVHFPAYSLFSYVMIILGAQAEFLLSHYWYANVNLIVIRWVCAETYISHSTSFWSRSSFLGLDVPIWLWKIRNSGTEDHTQSRTHAILIVWFHSHKSLFPFAWFAVEQRRQPASQGFCQRQ